MTGQPLNNEPQVYSLRKALKYIIAEYNERIHSTIKMTPNEAYFQKYITTKTIINFTAEMIRLFVVERIKKIGSMKNLSLN